VSRDCCAEREAVDLVPLIASLVQLILDPYCRTVNGFQELIDREWVALSHRFYDRYSTMSSEQVAYCLLSRLCSRNNAGNRKIIENIRYLMRVASKVRYLKRGYNGMIMWKGEKKIATQN